MQREVAVPQSRRIACICGSAIAVVPFTGDHAVMVPIDVDRDPDGGLVVVGSRAGFTIRPLADGEVVEGRFRRRAHWDTCPHRSRWHDVMRAVGVAGAGSAHDPMRAGPCARCFERHPWHYGAPIASPVCDRCRAKAGMPLMGEYD